MLLEHGFRNVQEKEPDEAEMQQKLGANYGDYVRLKVEEPKRERGRRMLFAIEESGLPLCT